MTTNPLHQYQTSNHRPFSAVYADQSERLAAIGFDGLASFAERDLYKQVLQLDDSSTWMLTATDPTWEQMASQLDIQATIIRSIDDLTPLLIGDEYVLPTGLVIFLGSLDLANKALRISEGTVLRGFAQTTIVSTIDGVIRASGLTSPVIMREINIIADGGRCIDLSGPVTQQLNMFFCGFFGTSAGTISGFDVQSIKQCFVSAADGLTHTGTTNKLFISQSPFYNVTGSAITLGAELNASVADIDTSFFKFGSPGIAIKAETGYTVGFGNIRGSLIDGTAVPLDGLSPSDVNWRMTNNSGIRDSRVVGGYFLDTAAETTIATVNTPVKVAGTTAALSLNERIVASTSNRLTYTGAEPSVVLATWNALVDTGNNVLLTFYVYKNGTKIDETASSVRAGSGSDERLAYLSAIVNVETNDYIELWVENNTNTTNVTCNTLTANVISRG